MLAEYTPVNGIPTKPLTLETMTIRPELRARMCGSTARVTRSAPMKLVSMIRCAISSSLSSTAANAAMPALLTSTSMPPRVAIA